MSTSSIPAKSHFSYGRHEVILCQRMPNKISFTNCSWTERESKPQHDLAECHIVYMGAIFFLVYFLYLPIAFLLDFFLMLFMQFLLWFLSNPFWVVCWSFYLVFFQMLKFWNSSSFPSDILQAVRYGIPAVSSGVTPGLPSGIFSGISLEMSSGIPSKDHPDIRSVGL